MPLEREQPINQVNNLRPARRTLTRTNLAAEFGVSFQQSFKGLDFLSDTLSFTRTVARA